MSSLVDEQWEFLQDVAALIAHIARPEHKLIATGGELWRTAYQQAENMRTGKSKTMSSKHIIRCAIDLNFFTLNDLGEKVMISNKEILQPIGDYWESLGNNTWGGNWDFYDLGHFQRNI